LGKEFGPGVGARCAQFARDLRQWGWGVCFYEGKKLWKGSATKTKSGCVAFSSVPRNSFELPVERFLKPGYVNVEAENLRGEGMLGGQVFCAPDALLPRGVRHWAIIGLQLEFVQPSALESHPSK
jgi:hypothetical protein